METYEEYLRRRMAEENKKYDIRPMPSVYDLQRRIEVLEQRISQLCEQE